MINHHGSFYVHKQKNKASSNELAYVQNDFTS